MFLEGSLESEVFLSDKCVFRPIYHTNVMMSIGTRVAVICSSSIQDKEERRRVCSRLMVSLHGNWTYLLSRDVLGNA